MDAFFSCHALQANLAIKLLNGRNARAGSRGESGRATRCTNSTGAIVITEVVSTLVIIVIVVNVAIIVINFLLFLRDKLGRGELISSILCLLLFLHHFLHPAFIVGLHLC